MKRKIPILLILFILTLSVLLAQPSSSIEDLIKEDVKNLISKIEYSRFQSITPDQILSRNNTRNMIRTAILTDEAQIISFYLSVHKSILDTLTISNPILASELVINLLDLYENHPQALREFSYYSAAAKYHQGLYPEAEIALKNYLTQYPEAPKRSDAFTLLLKNLISDNRDKEALKLIESTIHPLNEEQNYLAGHVCFSLEQDIKAGNYFSKVSTEPLRRDAEKMLNLIRILKLDASLAKQELVDLLEYNPNDPFTILTLARLSSMQGLWDDAEQYYLQYVPMIKNYRIYQARYELAITHLKNGNVDRCLELLDTEIHNTRELGDYILPLLMLWSEVSVGKGHMRNATSRINDIGNTISQHQELLREKTELIGEIEALRNQVLTCHSPEVVQNMAERVHSIYLRLEIINSILSKDYYGFTGSDLLNWKLYDRQITFSLLQLLDYYLATDNLASVQDTLRIKQLERLEDLYRDQSFRLKRIEESIVKLNDANTLLAIRNEIDDNLEILDRILANLYAAKYGETSQPALKELEIRVEAHERKKTETTLLLDYYDYDNSLYKQILDECRESNRSALELLITLAETKDQLRESYPKFVIRRERSLLSKEVNDLILLIPEYKTYLENTLNHLARLQLNVDYIGQHALYIETDYFDKQRKIKEQILSYEENKTLYEDNLTRKQNAYQVINDYVTTQSNSSTSPILSDFNWLKYAYFALAELSNSLYHDKPETVLSYYKKSLETDPRSYLADAILYNIGYYSNTSIKNRIENGIIRYESTFGYSALKPDYLKYTESTYREPIQTYKKIISEHKNSPFYAESLYRLAYLYFEIGTDAERPVDYYKIARDYYDHIIADKSNQYYYKALYQRGWTWLNSSSEDAYISAIEDFAYILTATENNLIADPTEALDYTIASKKNIAYCLLGLDGTIPSEKLAGPALIKKNLVGKISDNDLYDVLDETIDQKVKLYLPLQAIEYMNVKLELDPLAIDAPIFADSICALYSLYATQAPRGVTPEDLYIAQRERIVNMFGISSEWYRIHNNKNIPRQLQIIRKSYSDVEKRYNNLFVDMPTHQNFERYIKITDEIKQMQSNVVFYEQQHRNWNEETQANIIAQNIKLIQFSRQPKLYIDLANRIYAYNDNYPDNNNFLNLEGIAYNSARVLVDSLKFDYTTLGTTEQNLTLPLKASNIDEYYVFATDRFSAVLTDARYKSRSNDDIYISINFRQADRAKEKGQFALALNFYRKIIDFDGVVSNEVKRTAYVNLAEIESSNRNYKEAENWYKKAETHALNSNDRQLLRQYSLLQIQNAVDKAKEEADDSLVATEYIRLAEEYSGSDPNRSLQYKGQAQSAYIQAGNYQKGIDLLLEIASVKDNSTDVFNLYRLAWTIADSISNHTQAESLKEAFIKLYPNSNEAYQLRLRQIDRKVTEQSNHKQAGDLYLQLYEDVVNQRVDAKADNPADLYLAAIAMYDHTSDDTKKEILAEEFIKQYPNHSSAVTLMEFLADRYLEKGNMIRYEELSRGIFYKDKNNYTRYANIAKEKLRVIAGQFNDAYQKKDWPVTVAMIDEFTKVYNGFVGEGLSLDVGTVYDSFTQVKDEYKQYQARMQYLNRLNREIDNVEKGFLSRKPDNLIRVNNLTSWRRHMVAGENRIRSLKNLSDAEINKIKRVLDEGIKFDLDTDTRLKALNTISRISEHTAAVIGSQIDKYMEVTDEFRDFKRQFREAGDELISGFLAQKEGHTLSALNQAYTYYLTMYKYFYIPGYRNAYTQRAYTRLKELNSLPRYGITTILMNDSWSTSITSNEDNDSLTFNSEPVLGVYETKEGEKFSSLIIPAQSSITLETSIQHRVPFEFAIFNLVSPFADDTQILVNNVTTPYALNPISNLNTGDDKTLKYALVFGENRFVSGKNTLTIKLVNYDLEPYTAKFNLVVVSDSAKIEASTPIETIRVNTDDTWEYTKFSSDMIFRNWKTAARSYHLGFNIQQLYEMEETEAVPIWVKAADMRDSLNIVFQKEFNFKGNLRSGFIRFVAPDFATVYLNDIELSSEYELNYDEESGLVFPGQVTISSDHLRQGRNVLRIAVRNQSVNKGLMAEMKLTAALTE